VTSDDPFDALNLEELEEASGELHRRIAVALRRVGELRADERDPAGGTPRQRVAALGALIEIAAATLAATAAGGGAPSLRYDRHPQSVAAVMYAAPTIPALLHRLEQDRRLLASHARGVASRLHDVEAAAWGTSLRTMLSEVAIAEPAKCAQALERFLAAIEEAELAAIEAEAGRRREHDV
jgi:hypothetical protein